MHFQASFLILGKQCSARIWTHCLEIFAIFPATPDWFCCIIMHFRRIIPWAGWTYYLSTWLEWWGRLLTPSVKQKFFFFFQSTLHFYTFYLYICYLLLMLLTQLREPEVWENFHLIRQNFFQSSLVFVMIYLWLILILRYAVLCIKP